MNFEWTKIAERGQYGNGFVDVYETNIIKKAVAIISYLPQFKDTDQKVVLTVLLEGKKNDWTDGKIKSIFQDVEERITNVQDFKFNVYNSLEYMTTQVFVFEKLDNIDFINMGEYTFMK